MLECLETNKICSNGKKKCKVCKFDTCKEVLKMIKTQEEREDKRAIEKIKKELPEECKKCSIWNAINAKSGKIYCPYRINERCVIK